MKGSSESPDPSGVDLTIESLGARADGTAHYKDSIVYIPFTVPGDRVRVALEPASGKAGRGRILERLDAGPDRVEPVCRHFGLCGGCSLQMLGADAYREWLVGRISTALGHHGFDRQAIDPPVVSPPGSRRRIVLEARGRRNTVTLGFHRSASNQLIDIVECPVADAALEELLAPLRDLLSGLLVPGKGARLTATVTDSGIDLFAELPALPDLGAREELAQFAQHQELAALTVSDGYDTEPIVIARQPRMTFDGVSVDFPSASFIQATREGQGEMTDFIVRHAAGARRIADLFAGIGTFSIPLTRTADVVAVEGSAAMVGALQAVSKRIPERKALTVLHRDLFRRPLAGREIEEFDTVVLDPPRAGAKAQCAALAESNVSKVIALSCNPNTFARDARLLADGGFVLTQVLPIGQFLWSHHVELAAAFVRG